MKTCQYCGTQWDEGECCPNCHRYEIQPEQYPTESAAIKPETLWIVGIIIAVFMFVMVGIAFVFITLANFKTVSNNDITENRHHEEAVLEEESQTVPAVIDIEADRENNLAFQREKGIFVSGFYEVGTDIPVGEYAAIANGNTPTLDFYMGIYTSPSQSEESTIMSGWYQGCKIVRLDYGQYIDLTHANLYDIQKNELPMDPFRDSGMYRVGVHIEEGTYKVVNISDQYTGQYTIYSSINSIAPLVRDAGMVHTDEFMEVTLRDGEYIEMRFCCLEK